MKLLKTISQAACEIVEAGAEAAVTTCSAVNHVAKAADLYAAEVEEDARHSCNLSRQEREAEIAELTKRIAAAKRKPRASK